MKRVAGAALSRLSLLAAWPAAVTAGEFDRPAVVVRFLPEPSTLLLIGIALLCVVIIARHAQRRRRRKD